MRKQTTRGLAATAIHHDRSLFTFQHPLQLQVVNAPTAGPARVMERFLREWRDAAKSREQLDTAVFVGDKLLALTGSDQDAIYLANLHFTSGNFARAQGILGQQNLVARYPECKYLSAHCSIKQGRFDEALTVLGDRTPGSVLASISNNRRKLPKTTTAPRGGKSPAMAYTSQDTASTQEGTNARFTAGMCYLRGLCYAKQNAFDRAKDCYKDAVRIDVQCFEAFDHLMKNALMSPDEEWAFLESLNFDSIQLDSNSNSQQAGELVKMLYTTRLSKYKNPNEFTAAVETLSTHYKLASNPDLLLARAELFFTQCKFREALALTEAILDADPFNFAALPVHLACLHELNEKNALFLLSHNLAERHPEEASTWLAVGVYYLTISKIPEARRFFSKASMMDPQFGPAWIGFAHTFAAEGEHDQAISAYATAARLFQGTHLPQLFLGMQNLSLHNLPLAREYLQAAHNLCQTDPLLLNEMGVVFYHEERFAEAVNVFRNALEMSSQTDSDPRAWVSTRTNLGHAYRRLGHLEDALAQFNEVMRLGGTRDGSIFTAKGMVLLEMGNEMEAVGTLHEALAINPQDSVAGDLLAAALQQAFDEGMLLNSAGRMLESEDNGLLQARLDETRRRAAAGRRAGRRARLADVAVSGP